LPVQNPRFGPHPLACPLIRRILPEPLKFRSQGLHIVRVLLVEKLPVHLKVGVPQHGGLFDNKWVGDASDGVVMREGRYFYALGVADFDGCREFVIFVGNSVVIAAVLVDKDGVGTALG